MPSLLIVSAKGCCGDLFLLFPCYSETQVYGKCRITEMLFSEKKWCLCTHRFMYFITEHNSYRLWGLCTAAAAFPIFLTGATPCRNFYTMINAMIFLWGEKKKPVICCCSKNNYKMKWKSGRYCLFVCIFLVLTFTKSSSNPI